MRNALPSLRLTFSPVASWTPRSLQALAEPLLQAASTTLGSLARIAKGAAAPVTGATRFSNRASAAARDQRRDPSRDKLFKTSAPPTGRLIRGPGATI